MSIFKGSCLNSSNIESKLISWFSLINESDRSLLGAGYEKYRSPYAPYGLSIGSIAS